MEQIAENTADSLTESVKEVNQFTQYFQGKMPGLMDLGIKLVIVLIAFFVCRKIIQLILKIFGRSFERAGMEAASAHFTLSIMKAIMYVMVVAVMATFLGVSGASGCSMGVGVVLALKESLSNIAGGFILLFMKPFVSGDYIHEDTHGNEGTVVKVDLFYTTLLTIDNRTVSIPNGIITNSSLTNISKQDKRQLREKVGISYRNDINEARKVLLAILQKDAAILKEEKIEVVVESLGDSGVILGWHAWVRPQDYFPAKWRITEEIKYRFDENQIEIPYQQIDVKISR